MPRNGQARLVVGPVDLPAVLPRPVMVRAANLDPGAEYRPHSHDWPQLAYASDGLLAVETAEGSWTVPPARAVWIPGGVVHAIRSPVATRFRSLYIAAAEVADMPARCHVLRVSPLLRELILAAVDLPLEYDEDGPDGRLMAVILDRVREMREEQSLHLPMSSDRRLQRMLDALIAEPGDNRPLEDWAGAAGASARTLARRFLRETGLTFGQWRQRARLVAAVRRLAEGAPVTTVALELGYDSPSAFAAMFRRALGATPTAYLRQGAGPPAP